MTRPVAILILLAAAALAGCGARGDPQLPEGVSDTYPAAYPQGAVPGTRENIFSQRRR